MPTLTDISDEEPLGPSARRMAAYDSLPPALRDFFKEAQIDFDIEGLVRLFEDGQVTEAQALTFLRKFADGTLDLIPDPVERSVPRKRRQRKA